MKEYSEKLVMMFNVLCLWSFMLFSYPVGVKVYKKKEEDGCYFVCIASTLIYSSNN